jgi:hypothetical protein
LQERKQDLSDLSFRIFDASTLYNQFASKYDMWTECLHIIHTCNSDEPDVVATLWRKIIYSLLPISPSNNDFNLWRTEQCEKAGISSQSANPSSFESGLWIGQLQCKLLRLGKAFYSGNAGIGGGAQGVAVFPVGFFARELEKISSWYLRLTNQTFGTAASSGALDMMSFNWVLKMFLDIGVPHRILLGYYERLYHEQGTLEWVTHVLFSIFSIITLWKKHALSPRGGKEALQEFASSCPHIVDSCEEYITELKAIPIGEFSRCSLFVLCSVNLRVVN